MSDKKSIILKLSVVVLTILIILLVWDGCSKKALLSAYKKQMSQLEFTNQSFEEIVNKDGSIAHFDENLIKYENPFFSDKELSIYKQLTKTSVIPIISETICVKQGKSVVTDLETFIIKSKINIADGVYSIVNGSLRLQYSVDEYPMLPNIDAIITEGNYNYKEFTTKFEFATNNTGNDELRPSMMGIHLVDEFI
jgi:hypothetical protein